MAVPGNSWRNLGVATPIYVTRKSASGETGTLCVALWLQLTMLVLFMLNVIGWGIYGIAELIGKI